MTGVNSLIQASASDYLMFKVVSFMSSLTGWREGTHLLALVHDEVILEVKDCWAHDIALDLKKELEDASMLRVPIKFEVMIGDNWSVKS